MGNESSFIGLIFLPEGMQKSLPYELVPCARHPITQNKKGVSMYWHFRWIGGLFFERLMHITPMIILQKYWLTFFIMTNFRHKPIEIIFNSMLHLIGKQLKLLRIKTENRKRLEPFKLTFQSVNTHSQLK